jgi:hypothetical protein
MSLLLRQKEIESESNFTSWEINTYLNKNKKLFKTNSLSSTNFQTINLKNKNPLILKENEKLKRNSKLLNYLNNSKINKITSNNKGTQYISRNSNLITGYVSKYNTTSSTKIKNFDIKRSKSYNFNKNQKDIKLNSLFKLPTLSKNNNHYNSVNTISCSTHINNKNKINNINIKNNFLNNQTLTLTGIDNNLQSNSSITKFNKGTINKNNKFNNLHIFMKYKYYDDVKEKLEKKFRDDLFIDLGVRDKIINIGKVSVFWNNVFDYCNCLFYKEKFNIVQQNLKKSFSKDENYKANNNKLLNKKLFTNIFNSKIINNKQKYNI